jgi:hypothetical protein
MHTPKVSSFSTINHNNVELNPLADEKPAHGTPRNQTCKVLGASAESSRAQLFEVNHKEAKPVERRLTYSSFSDDEITSDEEQERFQTLEKNSLKKHIDQDNKSPLLDDNNLLEGSINENNQDFNSRSSRHVSKVINQSMKKYIDLPIPPPLSYTKIVPLDEISDSKFIEEIQNLFLVENNIFGLELSLNDIFPLDYENQSPTEIQNYLNDRYRFICCYNKENELIGLLSYIIYTDFSSQIKKAAVQFYIENTDKSQPETLSRILKIFENVCKKEECNELSITSFDPQQKRVCEKYGYTIPGSLGALIKRL